MRVIETKEKKRPRASLLLKIAIAAFSLYMVAALVNQQIQISAKTNQLNEIQRQLEEQDVKNEELERALSDEGSENGGYDDVHLAIGAMASKCSHTYAPIPENVEVYAKLFSEYKLLHDYFGRGTNEVMKRLTELKNSVRHMNRKADA